MNIFPLVNDLWPYEPWRSICSPMFLSVYSLNYFLMYSMFLIRYVLFVKCGCIIVMMAIAFERISDIWINMFFCIHNYKHFHCPYFSLLIIYFWPRWYISLIIQDEMPFILVLDALLQFSYRAWIKCWSFTFLGVWSVRTIQIILDQSVM